MVNSNRMRTRLLLALALIPACATYTIATVKGYARDVPAAMYGFGPGTIAPEDLRKSGWVVSDKKDESESWVLGAPADGVNDVEMQLRILGDGRRVFQFLRVRYTATRLATYKDIVNDLLHRYGKPQVSTQVAKFRFFNVDKTSDMPRPSEYVVHRWRGQVSDVLLVGGLEAVENLEAGMQYQLFLVPPDGMSASAEP